MSSRPPSSDRTRRYGESDPASDATLEMRDIRKPPDQLVAGDTIGRYRIVSTIGRGGMGTVYAAHDSKLDRKVALKILHDEHVSEGASRLVQEAQALARLADPHVVTVYDAGEIDGRVYLAMQLVDGVTLGEALTRGPGVPQILSWFVAAGRGLEAAHAVGLVHRDFKPSNVLIDRSGRVAVTDFGLAHDVVAPDRPLAGTPAYMSPEQHSAQVITPASDQFSFCVAVWEALFDRHPYVESFERESMSPLAIGYAIYDAPLIPPPKRTRVPKPVIDALTRGLSRLPTERWPSMAELVAVLEPPPRVRVWPIAVVATVVAAAGTGAAVWYALREHEDPMATCAARAGDELGAVWSEARAKALDARLAASGKPYAHGVATAVAGVLDRYATTWRTNAALACAVPDPVSPRRTCLDGRLDALRSVVTMLADQASPDMVDRANAIVLGLPDLADCTDAASGASVPAALAEPVATLDREIQRAVNLGNSGDYEGGRAQLAALVIKADAVGWPPVAARAHIELADRLTKMVSPLARDEAYRAAELAVAEHLDRTAVRAWLVALRAASLTRSADAVLAVAPMVRGLVARLHDPVLAYDAEVAYGRALVAIHRQNEAANICRAARKLIAVAPTWPASNDARDCLVEALLPLGAYRELEPIVAELIAERSKQLGPDHPMVSDYLEVQSGMLMRAGKLADALAIANRVLAIRRRVYAPGHVKIASSLDSLADIYDAQGDTNHATELYAQALELASAVEPPPVVLLGALHTALAFAAERAGHHADAISHFDTAIAVTREHAGPNTVELAVLLLNYGQIRADDNLDVALGMLGEATAILERQHDKRAAAVRMVEAKILANHRRWPEVRRLLDEALEHPDVDTEPVYLADSKWTLARALVETHGDRKRARRLATEARALFVAAGPSEVETVKGLDVWLKSH